jgi:hypothetical protein
LRSSIVRSRLFLLNCRLCRASLAVQAVDEEVVVEDVAIRVLD